MFTFLNAFLYGWLVGVAVVMFLILYGLDWWYKLRKKFSRILTHIFYSSDDSPVTSSEDSSDDEEYYGRDKNYDNHTNYWHYGNQYNNDSYECPVENDICNNAVDNPMTMKPINETTLIGPTTITTTTTTTTTTTNNNITNGTEKIKGEEVSSASKSSSSSSSWPLMQYDNRKDNHNDSSKEDRNGKRESNDKNDEKINEAEKTKYHHHHHHKYHSTRSPHHRRNHRDHFENCEENASPEAVFYTEYRNDSNELTSIAERYVNGNYTFASPYASPLTYHDHPTYYTAHDGTMTLKTKESSSLEGVDAQKAAEMLEKVVKSGNVSLRDLKLEGFAGDSAMNSPLKHSAECLVSLYTHHDEFGPSMDCRLSLLNNIITVYERFPQQASDNTLTPVEHLKGRIDIRQTTVRELRKAGKEKKNSTNPLEGRALILSATEHHPLFMTREAEVLEAYTQYKYQPIKGLYERHSNNITLNPDDLNKINGGNNGSKNLTGNNGSQANKSNDINNNNNNNNNNSIFNLKKNSTFATAPSRIPYNPPKALNETINTTCKTTNQKKRLGVPAWNNSNNNNNSSTIKIRNENYKNAELVISPRKREIAGAVNASCGILPNKQEVYTNNYNNYYNNEDIGACCTNDNNCYYGNTDNCNNECCEVDNNNFNNVECNVEDIHSWRSIVLHFYTSRERERWLCMLSDLDEVNSWRSFVKTMTNQETANLFISRFFFQNMRRDGLTRALVKAIRKKLKKVTIQKFPRALQGDILLDAFVIGKQIPWISDCSEPIVSANGEFGFDFNLHYKGGDDGFSLYFRFALNFAGIRIPHVILCCKLLDLEATMHVSIGPPPSKKFWIAGHKPPALKCDCKLGTASGKGILHRLLSSLPWMDDIFTNLLKLFLFTDMILPYLDDFPLPNVNRTPPTSPRDKVRVFDRRRAATMSSKPAGNWRYAEKKVGQHGNVVKKYNSQGEVEYVEEPEAEIITMGTNRPTEDEGIVHSLQRHTTFLWNAIRDGGYLPHTFDGTGFGLSSFRNPLSSGKTSAPQRKSTFADYDGNTSVALNKTSNGSELRSDRNEYGSFNEVANKSIRENLKDRGKDLNKHTAPSAKLGKAGMKYK